MYGEKDSAKEQEKYLENVKKLPEYQENRRVGTTYVKR